MATIIQYRDEKPKRTFWYKWIFYIGWFYWNYARLFLETVFREWHGQRLWPWIAHDISAQIWLNKEGRQWKLLRWGL
jgi:hypothetical protein